MYTQLMLTGGKRLRVIDSPVAAFFEVGVVRWAVRHLASKHIIDRHKFEVTRRRRDAQVSRLHNPLEGHLNRVTCHFGSLKSKRLRQH